MRHIALITLHTPTPTNFHGASALPFHLIAFRPENVDMEVWSFNLNGCGIKQIDETAKKLGVKIHVLENPAWYRLLTHALIRLFLPKPVLSYLKLQDKTQKEIYDYLNSANDSGIWIYGEDIAGLARNFNGISRVVTTPDCEAMYYHRVLAMEDIPLRKRLIARYALMYHRYAKMASCYPADSKITYHLVGEEDKRFLQKLNPRLKTVFIHHPHYDVSLLPRVKVRADEKIRLLIAGRYDFTMSQAVNHAMSAILSLPGFVKNRYHITFLGRGWERCHANLVQNGFSAEHKGYVDDYAAEVSSHHIQLTPIAVGTGTKGKVLDAFANGLMVIGTPLALENIAVKNGEECIEYSSHEELTSWLEKLAADPALIVDIASKGTQAVLSHHSRKKIAKEFFDLFN